MKHKHLVLLAGIVLALVSVSCKPTEKNYKAAYDAALSKRQAEKNDPDMALMLGGHTLDTSEGSSAFSADSGVAFPVKSTRLKFEEDFGSVGEWYVAVSRFSMPTNARAQARDLTAAGYEARVAENPEKQWYVIINRSETKEQAGTAASEFVRTHSGFHFTGLDSTPLLLLSPTRSK